VFAVRIGGDDVELLLEEQLQWSLALWPVVIGMIATTPPSFRRGQRNHHRSLAVNLTIRHQDSGRRKGVFGLEATHYLGTRLLSYPAYAEYSESAAPHDGVRDILRHSIACASPMTSRVEAVRSSVPIPRLGPLGS